MESAPSLNITTNILDPIQSQLPEIWDNPTSDTPNLKPRYAHFITKHVYAALERHGYENPGQWANLYLSGSLTTYQYGPGSDVDVNVFVDASKLPEWSRAEMVGIMVSEVDGTMLPGTAYPLQVFVMPHDVKPADKYQQHIRSGYSIDHHKWIEPPDRSRVMDVKREENAWYVAGLEAADKMESLLKYEPQKALMYFDQIHRRRQQDSLKGDFGPANIIYKFLERHGLVDKLHALMHTASFGRTPDEYSPEQLDNIKQETRPIDPRTLPIGDPALQHAVQGSRYNYLYRGSKDDWYGPRHEYDVEPVGAPAWHEMETYGRTKRYGYDPQMATPANGQFGADFMLHNPEWQNEFDFENDPNINPNYLYRGMSGEEWQNAQKNGYMQTNGEYNIANEGGTMFSTDPGQARSYATGFAPWHLKPGFNTPSYVVGVPYPHNAFKHPQMTGDTTEMVVPGQIPLEGAQAWQFKPYAQEVGNQILITENPNQTSYRPTGGVGNAQYAYRRVL